VLHCSRLVGASFEHTNKFDEAAKHYLIAFQAEKAVAILGKCWAPEELWMFVGV